MKHQFPLALLDVLPHGFELQRESLLVVSGDPSIYSDFHHITKVGSELASVANITMFDSGSFSMLDHEADFDYVC